MVVEDPKTTGRKPAPVYNIKTSTEDVSNYDPEKQRDKLLKMIGAQTINVYESKKEYDSIMQTYKRYIELNPNYKKVKEGTEEYAEFHKIEL